jgi:hypothetical protein
MLKLGTLVLRMFSPLQGRYNSPFTAPPESGSFGEMNKHTIADISDVAVRDTSRGVGQLFSLGVIRRPINLFAPILFVGMSAQADPINVASLPPRPEVLSALLIEVLVVALVVWRFRLRMARFLVAWYAVNLLTFYVLLQALVVMFDSFIIGELAVFAVEAAALLGLSRLSFFKSVDSKPIPFGWAIAASVAGNLSSILSFIGITALE